MSDIVRVKVHSGKKHKHHHGRGKSGASRQSRLSQRFPWLGRLMRKAKKFLKNHIFFSCLIYICLAGFIFCGFCALLPQFAQDYSNSFGNLLRVIPTMLFTILPIPIGEILAILALLFVPVWIVFLILALKRKFTHHHVHKKTRKILLAPITACLILLCIFVWTFAPAYLRPAVSQSFGISESVINDRDLYDTLSYFVNEINADAKQIEFSEDGFSVMPQSFRTVSSNLNTSYQSLSDVEYKNIMPEMGTPAKALLTSPLLLKFNIGGFYSFYTGEATVNTAYPDFMQPQLIAHELAHQRGIGAENDAEFISFLACTVSTDTFTRYSGHLVMLLKMDSELSGYLANCEDAEYREELRTNITEILSGLDERVKGEIKAYDHFCSEHHSEALSKISDEINDTYLKTLGNHSGTESYQKLTGLIVNFYTTYMA